MFTTAIFSIYDIEHGAMDTWMNSFRKPGFGVRVVGQVFIPSYEDLVQRMSVTVTTFMLKENVQQSISTRTTIDDIPEDPSIDIAGD